MPRLSRLVVLFLSVWVAFPVLAEYPEKPVKIVVPLAAGGSGDILTRMLGQELTSVWNQPVVVDNRPGAGTTIGTAIVAKSPPDGYTLLFAPVTGSISSSVYQNLSYDFITDFTPITMLVQIPFILAVRPSLEVRSVEDLIRLAKEQPGKLNFGSGGNGTMSHMSLELLKARADIDIVHVPYKGSNPALLAMLGGEMDGMFDAPASLLPHIKAGRLRALAVTTGTRSPSLPEVPTMVEAGLSDFQVNVWFGLTAPAGTPSDIVQKVYRDTSAALTLPSVAERLGQLGFDIVPMGPEEFGAYMRSEVAKWTPIVRAARLKAK